MSKIFKIGCQFFKHNTLLAVALPVAEDLFCVGAKSMNALFFFTRHVHFWKGAARTMNTFEKRAKSVSLRQVRWNRCCRLLSLMARAICWVALQPLLPSRRSAAKRLSSSAARMWTFLASSSATSVRRENEMETERFGAINADHYIYSQVRFLSPQEEPC